MDQRTAIPEFVITIVNRLEAAGYEAYIVGGGVRDTCLKRPAVDWDVATSASIDEIKTQFHGVKSYALKHGTISLLDDRDHYEVTTYRGPDGKGKTILEDLRYRDFTINAMAFDRDGKTILDPHGGRGDLRGRLIKAVGDPEDRFREDPLRLLRGVRLSVTLGFVIEQETLDAVTRMAGTLTSVARERIRDELMKILVCPRPSEGFRLMRKTGLLEGFLPELLEGYRKRQNRFHRYTIYRHIMETVDLVEPDPVLRLTALLHDIAKFRVRRKKDGVWRFTGHEEASAKLAGEIMLRLRFSNETIKTVVNLIEHHMIWYRSEWSDGAVRRLIRRVGPENIGRLIAFRRADLIAHGKTDHKIALLSELEKRVGDRHLRPFVEGPVDLAIDGRRVMALKGLPPGPEVGKILKRLMQRVTDHPELNTEEGLIGLLKEMK